MKDTDITVSLRVRQDGGPAPTQAERDHFRDAVSALYPNAIWFLQLKVTWDGAWHLLEAKRRGAQIGSTLRDLEDVTEETRLLLLGAALIRD